MPLTSHTLSVTLATLLIAAPAATAAADTHPALGNHAAAPTTQDLRSPDARDAARRAAPSSQDLRSPDARDAARRAQSRTSSLAGTTSPAHKPGRTADVYVPPPALFPDTVITAHNPAGGNPVGPPTWPAHPQSIPKDTRSVNHSSSGTDWTSIALALAVGLLAIGAAGISTRRRARVFDRHRRRSAIVASTNRGSVPTRMPICGLPRFERAIPRRESAPTVPIDPKEADVPSPTSVTRLTLAVASALTIAIAAAGCGGSNRAARPAADASKPARVALPAGRIVFRRYLDLAKTHGALFTINPDGTGEVQITAPPVGTIDDHPDWSPDGQRIAFQRCDARNWCQVFTIAADGTDERDVPARCQLSKVCQLSSPAWTPDGRIVATLADGRDRLDPASSDHVWPEASSLVLIDLERHTQRTLVHRLHWTGKADTPALSPDGRTVLYTRSNTSRSTPPYASALYVVGIDGKHNHQITPWKLGGGDHPGFAPNGTILFRSYEDDDTQQSDYWTVHPDGTGLHQLTHFKPGTTVLSTSYSPDGNWIAHATNGVAGNADIFIMRADGTDNRPVTRTKPWDSAPDWGPPGS